MVYYKTDEEIEFIRQSALLVSMTLAEVAASIRPGITTAALDKIAESFIRDHGAEPSFKGYRGFPATLCISVNEGVVHGIPGDYELREGDIVSVDCGAYANGFHGDSAYTFALTGTKPAVLKLLEVTKTALYKGIDVIKAGKRIGEISFAIQQYVEVKHKYAIVRELVGHGIGKNLHEDPEVPNYGKRNQGIIMQEGLVIAIEPMVNMGKKKIKQSDDGWTITTADKLPSAHYEHTVAVRKFGPDILSSFRDIEEQEQKNEWLIPVKEIVSELIN